MNQIEYFAIQNPCQENCRFNHRNICQTCFQSIEEHTRWPEASDCEKRVILRRGRQRRFSLQRETRRLQQAGKKRPVQQFELFPLAQDAMPHFPCASICQADDDNPQLALFPDMPAMSR